MSPIDERARRKLSDMSAGGATAPFTFFDLCGCLCSLHFPSPEAERYPYAAPPWGPWRNRSFSCSSSCRRL